MLICDTKAVSYQKTNDYRRKTVHYHKLARKGGIQMNYMEQVSNMLGVKLGKNFKVKDNFGNVLPNKYYLSERGLINEGGECENEPCFMDVLSGALTIVKRPFKPKMDEIYFCVCADGEVRKRHWCGGMFDYLLFNSGNCFRTKEEITEEIKEQILGEMKSKYESEDR